MGDVAMSVPVLRAFNNQHPNVKITVLTRKFFTIFFKDLKNVNVYSADVKGIHKGIKGLYKLSKELKLLDIDAVADLHNVLRSNILKLFLSGLKIIQIDKGRKEKKALIKGTSFEQLKTTHQRYADAFEKLGFPLDLSNPKFPKRQVLNDEIIELIGGKKELFIGVAPFAAHQSKMYPLDLMEDVISELSKTYKIILFGGGKEEVETLNTFQNNYDNVINVAGQLSLDDELNLMSNLNVMLSMDSGNAHLAAMLGIKVITIWGVTHPYAGFAPFHQPIDYTLVSDRTKFPKIPTSVYGNKYPDNYKNASGSISPVTIVEKVKSILS